MKMGNNHTTHFKPSIWRASRLAEIMQLQWQRVYVTKQAAKDALSRTTNLIEASESVGLSGSSRLHDLMVTCEGMTPGELKSGGLGVSIGYGVATTPFGDAIFGWTIRGICFLQFVQTQAQHLINELFQQWPKAAFDSDDQQAQVLANQVFSSPLQRGNIHLVLKGTNFQLKVWEALINTSQGQQLSYAQVAQLIGNPNANRAVGTALANNLIGYLIPCHRVIKSTGDIGNYRWGCDRKIAMLGWEAAQTFSNTNSVI